MDNGYWILRDRWDWWKKDTGRSDNSSIQYHTTVLSVRSGCRHPTWVDGEGRRARLGTIDPPSEG